MKRLTIYEPVEFSEDSYTERGEKVYKTMEVVFVPPAGERIRRVIECPTGIGITEEYIEQTILGCLEALEKDFPNDQYHAVRVAPNRVRFEYAGVRGVVN